MVALLRLLSLGAILGAVCATPIDADALLTPTSSDPDEALKAYLDSDPASFTFHPVEGMPTLEELNITMADFFKPEFRAKHNLPDPRNKSAVPKSPLLQKRFDPYCIWKYDGNLNLGYIQAAYACRDYLNSLGTKACVIGGGAYVSTLNCRMTVDSRTAVVAGQTNGVSSTQSYCRDVAQGMNWIIDNCHFTGNPCACGVGGANAANGNGNYIVWIKGSM